MTAAGLKWAQIRGSKIRLSAAAAITCLVGLVTSQLVTHYQFILISDQVQFDRRMEAAQKTEEKRRKDIEEWEKKKK